jgi:proteasome assembly chaperone (PAC2) family protein
MEGIRFLKRPRPRKPFFVVAWPGMGEVAFKAASFIIESLKAKEFAFLEAADFFYLTGSVIQKGIVDIPKLPESKFYFWKNKDGKNDLIIFLSNAQPDLSRAESYSQRIIQMAKKYQAEMIISFASMPQPIDHAQDSGVWFSATSQDIVSALKKFGLRMLNEGMISGMNGLFLGVAKKEGLKGFSLLGEIPLYTIQIENPKASAAVISALAKILAVDIDVSALFEQAKNMENEINKLLDYMKPAAAPGQGPIGEDEVEKIKKALSQLTKLPASVKDKIERLFSAAEQDLSRAGELKAELDKWNAYKEYEDRFLDLFRKSKEKGN